MHYPLGAPCWSLKTHGIAPVVAGSSKFSQEYRADTDTLVTTIDRYLMYYIRTAKRLQRTAPWQERFPGGLDELRRVIVDDHLGICADLDAAMARHVATYRCEWKATIEDPDKLRRFRTFINSDAPDGDIVMVAERDQHRPAAEWEKVSLLGVPT